MRDRRADRDDQRAGALEQLAAGERAMSFRSWSWCSPSAHHRGGALDRAQDADVRAAAALEAVQRVA